MKERGRADESATRGLVVAVRKHRVDGVVHRSVGLASGVELFRQFEDASLGSCKHERGQLRCDTRVAMKRKRTINYRDFFV